VQVITILNDGSIEETADLVAQMLAARAAVRSLSLLPPVLLCTYDPFAKTGSGQTKGKLIQEATPFV
jgi:hypothetical protein